MQEFVLPVQLAACNVWTIKTVPNAIPPPISSLLLITLASVIRLTSTKIKHVQHVLSVALNVLVKLNVLPANLSFPWSIKYVSALLALILLMRHAYPAREDVLNAKMQQHAKPARSLSILY